MSLASARSWSLSEEEQRLLRHRLASFAENWQPEHLAQQTAELPSAGSPLRLPLLLGLVQIDLERSWQHGAPPPLEDYLQRYPELAASERALLDLLDTEYRCRQKEGETIPWLTLAQRFPHMRDLLRQRYENTIAALPTPTTNETLPPENHPVTAASLPGPSHQNEGLPQQFGRYRILQTLGRGGMGAVYLALDTQLDRQVALKVPHLDTDNPVVLERFYREARLAATLHHPHICPIHDVGSLEGIHFLTMPHIEGESLAEWLRTRAPLSEETAITLMRQIALAVEEAHRKGIIHRDLKPANIMIDRRQEPIIMDFGLARRSSTEEARLTQSNTIVGTPVYMSPEQASGGKLPVGPASDVYSLGVILYEMLTGRIPFEGSITEVLCQIVTQNPDPLSRYRPGLTPRLEAICLQAMAKKPGDRFPSAAAFAQALADPLHQPVAVSPLSLVSSHPEDDTIPVLVEVVNPDPVSPTKPKKRSHPVLRFFIGCAVVCGVFMGTIAATIYFGATKLSELVERQFAHFGKSRAARANWPGTEWQAPSIDLAAENLFPPEVHCHDALGIVWQRGPLEQRPGLTAYKINKVGYQTTYTDAQFQRDQIEVYVLRVSPEEKKRFYQGVIDYGRQHNVATWITGGPESTVLSLSLSSPHEKIVLWCDHGWLYLARTNDLVDPEEMLPVLLQAVGDPRTWKR